MFLVEIFISLIVDLFWFFYDIIKKLCETFLWFLALICLILILIMASILWWIITIIEYSSTIILSPLIIFVNYKSLCETTKFKQESYATMNCGLVETSTLMRRRKDPFWTQIYFFLHNTGSKVYDFKSTIAIWHHMN